MSAAGLHPLTLRLVPDGDRDPRPAAQPGGSALAALACGAAAMFAVMYSTQAVLPRVAIAVGHGAQG